MTTTFLCDSEKENANFVQFFVDIGLILQKDMKEDEKIRITYVNLLIKKKNSSDSCSYCADFEHHFEFQTMESDKKT